ncbi:RNA polymerase sigma factor [Paenibacillus soyae]|uniref:RNA polymerase sigma factor n=1 Tax=Paenibacillus soyae TaxID=2969249 RepID=A0A9X2MPN6_9BACL|nr:RNA polymerase sigma factor [Paenibacillus soyae]MCR2803924.1 RNA polymerase sigma factor [Paenibacillus soyae]
MSHEEGEQARKSIFDDQETLINRIHQEREKMYGIAFAYLRNEQDALEAIQETVCRVWMKRRGLRDERYFATWMIRILINVCMDERKKRKREQPSENILTGIAAVQQEPSDRVGMAEQVAKLKPKYRMIIVLKYYRDLTITEIGELLDKPDGTIRTWLHKALKEMRMAMNEGEEEIKDGRFTKKGWGRSRG